MKKSTPRGRIYVCAHAISHTANSHFPLEKPTHVQVARVLKPNGVYFVVSYGVPDNRLSYLENEDYSWTVTVHTVAKPTVSATAVPDTKDANSVHYIYVCVKGGTADEG